MTSRDFLGDAWYGVRLARHQPAFTALVIGTLAMGIGILTATFSLLHAVLLRPLPYARQDALVAIQFEHPEQGVNVLGSTRTYQGLVSGDGRLIEVAGALPLSVMVEGASGEGEYEAAYATPSFFDLFATRLQGSRFERASSLSPGETIPVLLSHKASKELFPSDPGIVGRSLHLRGGDPLAGGAAASFAATIVGILPEDFVPPFASRHPEVWIVESFDRPESPQHILLFGRVHSGTTTLQAEAGLGATYAHIEQQRSPGSAWQLRLVPLRDQLIGGMRRPLQLLFLAGSLLLLVATANTALLLSARTATRRSEAAIRAMLGAPRGRLTLQFLAEGLTLVLPAAILGVSLAAGLLRLLPSPASTGIPARFDVRLDPVVLIFAALISLGTTVVFAVLPALRFSGLGPADALNGRATRSVRTRTWGAAGRWAFVALQIGIAMVTCVGSALLLRSFARLLNVDTGFDSRDVATAWLALPQDAYARKADRAGLYSRVLDELDGSPDVVAAGLASYLPLSRGTGGMEFAIEDSGGRHPGDVVSLSFTAVSPGYLEAMRIPLAAGRTFERRDLRELTLIVSEKAAQVLWGQNDVVGRRLMMGGKESGNPWSSVIGVVRDVRHDSLRREGEARVYIPLLQFSQMAVVARSTSGHAGGLAATMRKALLAADPTLSLRDLQGMDRRVEAQLATIRTSFTLMAFLTLSTMILAAVGISGAIWYSIVERVPEIRIHLALGARPADILRLMFRSTWGSVAAGLLAGVGLSLALGRYIASMLFEVPQGDPASLTIATLIVLALAGVAIYLPTRRASRFDPNPMLQGG